MFLVSEIGTFQIDAFIIKHPLAEALVLLVVLTSRSSQMLQNPPSCCLFERRK